MEDWSNVPVFGNRSEALPLVIRPSAYALIFNEKGDLAIVRQPLGGTLLYSFPGSDGIDPGETPEQAVIREAGEECGLIIRVEKFLAKAIQFASAKNGRSCFEKRSWFFTAKVDGLAPELIMPNHETFWVTRDDAARLLSHESHQDIAQRSM